MTCPAPGPAIDILVLRLGSMEVVVIVQTPLAQFGSDAGILKWIVSVLAVAFADCIAARNVQGPPEWVRSINTVPHTPSAGTASLASPVLSTVKVAADAVTISSNPSSGTKSHDNWSRFMT